MESTVPRELDKDRMPGFVCINPQRLSLQERIVWTMWNYMVLKQFLLRIPKGLPTRLHAIGFDFDPQERP